MKIEASKRTHVSAQKALTAAVETAIIIPEISEGDSRIRCPGVCASRLYFLLHFHNRSFESVRGCHAPVLGRQGTAEMRRRAPTYRERWVKNDDSGTLGFLFFQNQNAVQSDMYPLYWTPSRGGIIMRYTYEYKRKCVELYREGKWPETPEGVSDKSFRDKVRLWVRAEDSRGPEALKHKNFNRNWTPEERLELVSQVMSGKSCVSVAIEAGIQDRLLYQWVQNYKTKGYNGLVEMKKGRPSKGVPQMKKEEARPLNESEREELIRLRAENEYIKAENEVIKKEIALREERHAAQLKARKQRSSKSCVKKDTN